MGPHSTNSFRSKSSKNGFSLWSSSIKRLEYTLKIYSWIYFKFAFYLSQKSIHIYVPVSFYLSSCRREFINDSVLILTITILPF